jgi:hypothetical protein
MRTFEIEIEINTNGVIIQWNSLTHSPTSFFVLFCFVLFLPFDIHSQRNLVALNVNHARNRY